MVLATRSSSKASPPSRVQEYEFSLSRSTGKMRWRHGSDEWLCEYIVGDAWLRRADGDKGKLYIVGALSIDSRGNATIRPPEGALLEALIAEVVPVPDNARGSRADFPQGLKAHWRLCLNRQMRAWRIRDEERPNKIWNTNGYQGIVHISWMDHGPHIHVDQPAWLDEQGVVQF